VGKSYKKTYDEKLVLWFNDNRDLMNSIVEEVDSSQLDLKFAYQKDEGLIHIGSNPTETSPVFDSKLSPVLKDFFSLSKGYRFSVVEFGLYKSSKTISFESYYPQNQTGVCFVYTPEDVSYDDWYQHIEDNWYLYVSQFT
jgi:hypothetical protein